MRRQGIGRALMQHCIARWIRIGCTAGALIYAYRDLTGT